MVAQRGCCAAAVSRQRLQRSPIRLRGIFALRRSITNGTTKSVRCHAYAERHLSQSHTASVPNADAAGISRQASGLGDESSAQPPQRGSPFRQPTTKAHLEPLSEVPTHTTDPSKPRKRPPVPHRHLERKYDQSVIPSGCSVEAHSVKPTNFNCAAPPHRNRVSRIAVRLQSAPTASVHRNRAFGAARARARRLNRCLDGRRPSQPRCGASLRPPALPHYLMRTPNASATRTTHVQPHHAPSRGRAGARASPEPRRAPRHHSTRPQATQHTPPWARAAR